MPCIEPNCQTEPAFQYRWPWSQAPELVCSEHAVLIPQRAESLNLGGQIVLVPLVAPPPPPADPDGVIAQLTTQLEQARLQIAELAEREARLLPQFTELRDIVEPLKLDLHNTRKLLTDEQDATRGYRDRIRVARGVLEQLVTEQLVAGVDADPALRALQLDQPWPLEPITENLGPESVLEG
jgi:hypothetical protein